MLYALHFPMFYIWEQEIASSWDVMSGILVTVFIPFPQYACKNNLDLPVIPNTILYKRQPKQHLFLRSFDYVFLWWLSVFTNVYLRNNSWKPLFVSSFNMGSIIFINISSCARARDKMQRKYKRQSRYVKKQFENLYAPRFCMNTWIYLEMMSIICSWIHMLELKYIESFIMVLLCLPFKQRETYCFSLIFSSASASSSSVSASSASSQRSLSGP